MYANIVVKNPLPRVNIDAIPASTIFSYDLAPYNNAEININTLVVKLYITGGGAQNMVQRLTFHYGHTALTVVGDALTGYNIKVDAFPNFELNFESEQSIEVRIEVEDSLGNVMRPFRTHYRTINFDQYDALSFLLKDVTEIQVQNEQGRINHDGTEVEFGYRPWALNKTPIIYKNGIQITSGYTIDKVNGKLLFSTPLRFGDPVDIITADYMFSVFTDLELIGYLNQALSTYNGWRPASRWRLSNAPPQADAAIILGAASYALQAIELGFINQQALIKWTEADVSKLTGPLQDVKEKYRQEFEKVLEEKRYQLAGTRTLVTSEYTLPGGRSRFFRNLFKDGGGM